MVEPHLRLLREKPVESRALGVWGNCRGGLVRGDAPDNLGEGGLAQGRGEGCQNKAPGGESIREAGWWWVFVVFETDPDYPRTALARQLQDVHVSTCALCASADTDEDSF